MKYTRILSMLMALLLLVVLEFALNGKIPLPKPPCYGVMIAVLAGLSLNEIWAVKRMDAIK